MANKKVSQLTSKPSVLTTDLFPIADPSTGQLFKTTISDLGTAIGSGVSSVNSLVGAVVLDTDDIQELVSPTNKWFTDTRARAAISAGTGISYNSGTGVITNAVTSGQIATALGYTPANDASVVKLALEQIITASKYFSVNSSSPALTLVNSGTGYGLYAQTKSYFQGSAYFQGNVTIQSVGANSLVKLDGDQNLDTAVAGTDYVIPSALNSYLPLAGGTLTGALSGTSASFTGDLTISSTNPRIYFTDTDNNPDYFISNTDGTFTVYDVTNSLSRFTIGTTGNAYFRNAITGGGSITGESLYSNGIISAGTSLSVGTFVSAGGSLTGSALYVTGMTAGSGAIYHTASRLTFANYNTSGTLHFEVNGGTGALTINADTSASFVSTISATGATFTKANTSGIIDNNAYLRLVNTGASTLNQSIDLVMRWQDGTYNGTGGISMVRESATARSGKLIFQPIDSSGNNVSALTIASTGAATFAKSVSVGNSGNLRIDSDASNGEIIGASGKGLKFYTNDGVVNPLTFASGGATTFTGDTTFNASVAIGTTPTNRLFQVYGNTSTTTPLVKFENAGTGDSVTEYRVTGSSWYVGIDNSDSDKFKIGTELLGTGDKLTIQSDGNVGIGTTAPSSKLQVEVATESPATGAVALIAKTSNGNNDIFRWYDGTTQLGVFKNSGYVGIGTSSPSRLLHINASSDTRFLITDSAVSSTTGTYYRQFGSNSAIVNQSNGTFQLGTNDSYFLTATSSGNVGIGTTSPNLTATNRTTLDINGTTSSLLGLSVGGTAKAYIYHSGTNFAISNYTNGGNMDFNTYGADTDTTRMRITSTGVIAFNGSASPNSGGLDKLSMGFDNGVDGWIQTWSGRPLSLNSQGNNVLIGTRSDVGGRLQVNGDIRAYGSFFRETGNITVNNGWTNVFTINTASQRTYLLQIIATNSEASLSYRYFGVIQGNPASSSYTAVSLASQTMEVQLSGSTIQTRLTNSNQFNFNWSITQLL